jgi:hypothetical protein
LITIIAKFSYYKMIMKTLTLITCVAIAFALVGCGKDASKPQASAQAQYSQDSEPALVSPVPVKSDTKTNATQVAKTDTSKKK